MQRARVQLICMPFQNVSLSSLSIALLGSVLRNSNVDVVESYLHFEFAQLIGNKTYRNVTLGGTKNGFAGEILFAESYQGYVNDANSTRLLDSMFGSSHNRINIMKNYKEYCLAQLSLIDADLIGFTTSFNQLFPSIWLAYHIKKHWPHKKIVFGGSACSTPMCHQIRTYYSFIDYIVAGPGEKPLLELALGREFNCSDGIIINEEAINLDSLPIPDYTTFMSEAKRYSDEPGKLMLAFETSRGCWWGEKNHCLFCGLNQSQIVYYAKKSERAIREIRYLWKHYQTNLFATDAILSLDHLKSVLPTLAEYKSKPSIFYEIKANMSRQDIELLRKAGVIWVQPGIESLSSRILGLINKGVTAIQNIALLKWCCEQGIKVSWNLLCDIPGERVKDYDEQIALFEKIPHFSPPQGVSPLRLDRYSPYFEQHELFGWSRIKPFEEYRFLHPQMNERAIYDIAYHFHGDNKKTTINGYLKQIQDSIDLWEVRHSRGDGLYWDKDFGLVKVVKESASKIHAKPMLTSVIENTHNIISLSKLIRSTGCEQKLIDELVEWGALHREGNKIVNLALQCSL